MASGGQLKQASAAKKLRRPESGAARAAQIRVLIAEDNMINMKVAMGILNRMGYQQARPHPSLCTCTESTATKSALHFDSQLDSCAAVLR